MATKVGGIIIEIATDIAKIQSDMGKAVSLYEKGTRKITRLFQAVGVSIGSAFAIRGVVNWVGAATEAMAATSKLSQSLGMTTESLSTLQYAARLADLPTEDLSTGVRQLTKNLMGVKGPTKEAAAALRSIGVATNAGHDAESWIKAIADGFQRMPDGATKTAAALELLGKTGTSWIPLLNGGSENLRAMADEAERLGLKLSESAAREAEAFRDEIDRLKASFDGLGVTIGTAVAPALKTFFETWNRGILEGHEFRGLAEAMGTLFSNRFALAADKTVKGRLDFYRAEAKRLQDELLAMQKFGGLGRIGWGKVDTRSTDAVRRQMELMRDAADRIEKDYQAQLAAEEKKRQAIIRTAQAAKKAAEEAAKEAAQRAELQADFEMAMREAKALYDQEAEAAKKAAQRDKEYRQAQVKAWQDTERIREEQLKARIRREEEAQRAAIEAAQDLARAQKDAYDRMASAVRGYAEQMGDWLVTAARTGKTSMKDMVASILSDFLRLQSARAIFNPILGGLAGAMFGNRPTPSTSVTAANQTPPYAGTSGSATAFGMKAGGVILYRPTKLANGGAIGGDGGQAEGVLPLVRGRNGDLGVQASGGSGVTVQIFDQRGSGAPVTTQETAGPDGERILRAIIRDEQQRSIANGSMDSLFRDTYRLRRQGVHR